VHCQSKERRLGPLFKWFFLKENSSAPLNVRIKRFYLSQGPDYTYASAVLPARIQLGRTYSFPMRPDNSLWMVYKSFGPGIGVISVQSYYDKFSRFELGIPKGLLKFDSAFFPK
jgi:hypothetical protein